MRGYGDTYFILNDKVVKITEVKFREGVSPEEIIRSLRKLHYIKELKIIPKNDHHIIYSRIDVKGPFSNGAG